MWNKRSAEGLRKSITYFQQAIDLDPNYALSYAGLADSYALLSNYDVLPPEDSYPMAKAAAMKALEIDNTLAEAYTSLAVVKVLYAWDWPGAEREFKRAIELNPHYANRHYYYSYDYLSPTGRHQEAIAEMKRAQELDPLSAIINTNLGRTYHFARQYDRAIEQYRKALEIDPNFGQTHFRLGEAYGMKGMFEEAVAELKKTRDLSAGKVDDIDASLAYIYAVSGKRGEARKLVNELKERSKQSYSPYLIAMIYTGLGDKEQALAWLQKAYEERTGWLLLLKISREPFLMGAAAEPRIKRSILRNSVSCAQSCSRQSVCPSGPQRKSSGAFLAVNSLTTFHIAVRPYLSFVQPSFRLSSQTLENATFSPDPIRWRDSCSRTTALSTSSTGTPKKSGYKVTISKGKLVAAYASACPAYSFNQLSVER